MMRYFLAVSLLVHVAVFAPLAAPRHWISLPSGQFEVALSAAEPSTNADHKHARKDATLPTKVNDSESRPAGPVGSTSTAALSTNQLESVFRLALRERFVYPALARKYGWEGRVVVGITASSAHGIEQIQLVRPSSHTLLDEAAIVALRRIGSLPEVRRSLPETGQYVEIPVIYRLRDS